MVFMVLMIVNHICRSATKTSNKIDAWQYGYLIRHILSVHKLNASTTPATLNGVPCIPVETITTLSEPQAKRGMKKESGEMKCLHGANDAAYWPSDSCMTIAIDQVGILSILY